MLDSIIQKNFPNEFRFVGDGSILIEGFNPDFIDCNGRKLIIEMNGTHWHNIPEMIEKDKRKMDAYSRYGYRTLIIWENELNNYESIKCKIREFLSTLNY